MVDLDDFKRINDTNGHQAGDEALVAVARALGQAALGANAVIARSGGEEFTLAAVWHVDDPGPLARRICDAVAGLREPVTASVGTACMGIDALHADRAGLGANLDRLVAAADMAMYHAKRAGGNRYHHSREQRP
jgi:diguanylate cyclase (GGDEF)-like protein